MAIILYRTHFGKSHKSVSRLSYPLHESQFPLHHNSQRYRLDRYNHNPQTMNTY